MNALAAAIRLLTVLPWPGRESSPGAIANSIAFFPFVGLAIGSAMALIYWVAGEAMPPFPAGALAVAAGVALTGALHLDGLADTFDGLFGGTTPERRLEIMRDASTGVFGIVAVVVVLMAKWGAVASLSFGSGWAAVLLAPAMSRAGAAWVISMHDYARPEGLGSPYRRGLNIHLLFALFVAAGAAVALMGVWALLALLVAVAVAELVARFADWKLDGGLTGDVYGACIELAEAASLLWLLAMVYSGFAIDFPLGG